MKVYGGLDMRGGKQIRVIVATKTKKRATELFEVSIPTFNTWYSETGNKKELEIALAEPEVIFWTELDHGTEYRKLEK